MHDRFRRAAASTAVAALCCLAFAAPGPGNAVLVSLGEGGVSGNGDSFEGSVSNNGRVVAFYSYSDNLVADDGNLKSDVFVRDLRNGAVELVSRNPDGLPGNDDSYFPVLSANGRWVLFSTGATDIAPGAVNGGQVVLHDRRTGESVEVSAAPDGGPGDGFCDIYDCRPLSGNGRFAVFSSSSTNLVPGDMNGFRDVFLADLRAGTVERISNGIAGEADGQSIYPSISPNGRWVIFCSRAKNLVAGDANGSWDVFLYDVKRRNTTLVSRGDGGVAGNGDSGGEGEQAASVSNNGRLVAFRSEATNLDADSVDTNGLGDIFLRDLRAGTTKRISLGPTGAQGDGYSADPALDPAGRRVTFWTYASNLVDATDTVAYDQIVHDVAAGTNSRMLERMAGGSAGEPTGGTYGYWSGFSANGRWFAVASDGSDVVAEDGNGSFDVFLVDMKR